MSKYKLKLEFLNQSEDFGFGFECGKIYQEMMLEMLEIKGMFHVKNLEQIKLMAETFEYSIVSLDSLQNIEAVQAEHLFIKMIKKN